MVNVVQISPEDTHRRLQNRHLNNNLGAQDLHADHVGSHSHAEDGSSRGYVKDVSDSYSQPVLLEWLAARALFVLI
jgi:hypothetical protein